MTAVHLFMNKRHKQQPCPHNILSYMFMIHTKEDITTQFNHCKLQLQRTKSDANNNINLIPISHVLLTL